MQTKQFHGSSANKLTYAYNLRGWLTGISGSKYTQNLYYNTGAGTAKYNGSISSMTWKAGTEGIVRNLCYLLFSVVLAMIILYVIIANMIDYTIEDAFYYLAMFLKYMKLFLFYVFLNIFYLIASIISHYKRKYCKS